MTYFPKLKMGMNRKNSIDGLFPLHSERRLGAVATVSATIDQARLKVRPPQVAVVNCNSATPERWQSGRMRRFAKLPAVGPLQSFQQLTTGSRGFKMGSLCLIRVYLLPTLLPEKPEADAPRWSSIRSRR